MPHLIRAEITVETDDLQGYSADEYIIGLKGNLSRAIGDGMLTGATPEVEIDGYRMSVTHNPESRLDEIEAYYAEAVESEAVAWLWVVNGHRSAVPKDYADELIEDGETVLPLYTHPASADNQAHWSQGSPGLADQYRQEAFAAREALGFSCDSLEVSPADIRQAIADNQAASVPEWTDINLRQPDEYQVVLWFCQGGNIRTGMYYGKNHCDRVPETHPISGKGRPHYGKFGRYAEPAESGYIATHWMPLPDPPEQEQGHEWIKCSEQRPNVLDVWIKMTDGSVVACWSQLDGDFYWNGGGSESYILENTVTHWKPRQQEKDQ
jgi:hypothetical protein